MIFKWLVYDRQNRWFEFIQDLDYNAKTAPRIIYQEIEGRQKLVVHTSQFWRYAPYGLYQFPDDTIFPYSFPCQTLAWEWYSKRAIPAVKAISQSKYKSLCEISAFCRWTKDGNHNNHLIHWSESEKEFQHLLKDRFELATFSALSSGRNEHFYAPAIIKDTIRKIVIDPR